MSEEYEDTTGYVLAGEYAEQKNLQEWQVTKDLKNGSLEGRVIGTSWYVKDWAGKTAEEIAVERRANIEASAKAQNEYKKSIKPVQVIGISIPFGDVLTLSFQGLIAGLIIVIPIAVLIIAISNS
jgi:hypothetical protein